MNQYCRYCMNAIDYDDMLICKAEAPCGKYGSGKSYSMEKAKRLNKCKHFDFNPNDLLWQNEDGTFRQYKPRIEHEKNIPGQLELGGQYGKYNL